MAKIKKLLIALTCMCIGVCAMGFVACGKAEHEHTWDAGTVTKAATCTDAGEMTFKCTSCEEGVKTELIAKTGHSEDAGTETKAATCAAEGEKTYKCTSCGETIRTEAIAKKAHAAYEVVVKLAPTCEEDGYSEEDCVDCKATKENSKVVIPALGHAWEYGTWTLNGGATVTTDRCARACLGETEELDANGDVVLDADNKPVMVPAYLYASYDLEFDGTTALGVGNCYDKKIYIPSNVTLIDGAFKGFDWITRVEIIGATEIGEDAFSDCVNVTKVVLGNQVTKVGANAFANCEKLVEIEIPDSVTEIGANAFADCVVMNKAVIGDGVTVIGEYAFSGCSQLSTVAFGEGLETIAAYAFSESGLTKVEFPDSVTTIDEYAFSDCAKLTAVEFGWDSKLKTFGPYVFSNSKLTTISMPRNLAEIKENAFSGVTSLTAINVYDLSSWLAINFETGNANPLSNSSDVVLKDDAGNSLTDITINANVINAYAFYGYQKLTNVTIADNVTVIGDEAFANCANLQSVVIGENVTAIGNAAFANCVKLATIAYNAVACADLTKDANVFAKAGVDNKAGIALEVGTSVTKIPANMFLALQYSDTANLVVINFLDDVCPDAENHVDGTCVHINSACTTIGASAFERTPVATVKLASTITDICEKAFYRCEKITTLNLPETVTTIGDFAFDGCDAVSKASGSVTALAAVSQASLKDVTITSGDITDKMFDACTALTTVVIEEGVTSIGRYAFAECPVLANVTIEANVAIGEYAFLNCKALTTVTMEVEGDGVMEIGEGAFHNCKQLKTVSFDDALVTIGEVAFKNCEALKEITLGMNLAKIGAKAFEGAGLTSVDFLNRFNWYIGGSTETEWTTALATKATAAAYLTKVDDPATDVVEGYMDCVWENK